MKEISLTQGAVTTVDDDDYEKLSAVKWHIDGFGYASRKIPRPDNPDRWSNLYMHRAIVGLAFGDVRKVDHIDGNKLNNARANLRVCSNAENSRNCKTPRSNTSGFKGVTWDKEKGKWLAQIKFQNKNNYLGRFDSPEEAYAAYCEAARRLHGNFANFG
jgi:hypothetical protein